ncbi:putative membrane protein [Micromonospora palomenae]|uniref:Putative membrane protein n=1 Tax=Micromonospora palomenae TaxID=1461247 RepID=A0A561WXK0_9ACTN|nr:TMEM175 family protein [Micromonospora palomenae]TWG28588.1 putative membrane protein [Micromonospora palomenae]
MTRPSEDPGTRADLSRTVAFSDAVLAIILTLLVLDPVLRVPEVRPGHLLPALLDQWPRYAAYFASFSYVAVVWLNHKATFHRIRKTDRGLHYANLFILFTTALMPFPTAVVSHAFLVLTLPDQRVAIAFYAAIGALMCASWLAFFQYLARRPDLVKDEVDERFYPAERLRAMVGVVLYAVAGVAGYLIAPLIGMGVFVVLPVFYAITSAGLYATPFARRIAHRPPPPA